jgi:hypothetical protein
VWDAVRDETLGHSWRQAADPVSGDTKCIVHQLPLSGVGLVHQGGGRTDSSCNISSAGVRP